MNIEEYIRPYNKLLNIVLQKKFKWFEKIELDDLKYGGVRNQQNFINPVGKIYVDSNWGYKQWREYHYDTPFYYDEELNFGDIIGGDLSKEIQKQFKICFSTVIGESTPKYMSFSWLTVVLVDKEKDTIKESIRRILREELYSPAGKEIIPNKIVVHKSNPMFRDRILEEGLKARAGECYKIYVGYGIKCRPAIFATNSTNKRAWFDSTYDDDVWEINTEMIPDVKWFKDRHYESRSKHIVTFQDIPVDAITLKYEGTGSGDYKLWSKDSPNRIQESHKEKGNEKANLVRKMIHRLYDNVSFIKQSTFNGKPHIRIYFDSDDTVANIESWFDEKISRDINELTSGIITVCPDWAARWDSRREDADVYINTELLKYDDSGNVINESSKSIRRILREEMEFSFGFRRRIETFKAIVWNNFATNYPCDYDDFSHFMRGVRQEIIDAILEGENDGEPISDWLTLKEAEDYIEKYMIDDLKEFYVSRCLE